jgi:hypothetical protein
VTKPVLSVFPAEGTGFMLLLEQQRVPARPGLFIYALWVWNAGMDDQPTAVMKYLPLSWG